MWVCSFIKYIDICICIIVLMVKNVIMFLSNFLFLWKVMIKGGNMLEGKVRLIMLVLIF